MVYNYKFLLLTFSVKKQTLLYNIFSSNVEVIMHSYDQSEQQNPLQWIDFVLTTKEKKKNYS